MQTERERHEIMKALGIVGAIVSAVGIILISIILYYRTTSPDSGIDIFNFFGLLLVGLGIVMIVASRKTETKQNPS